MTSLAEDLLKTRPISDLRSLVHELRSDAENKRAELQSMVGSQYHEFIQSADKIGTMNEQARLLNEKLTAFWAQNQRVVQNVSQLLDQQHHEQEQQRGRDNGLHRTSTDLLQGLFDFLVCLLACLLVFTPTVMLTICIDCRRTEPECGLE
jgi:hypothetical protein